MGPSLIPTAGGCPRSSASSIYRRSAEEDTVQALMDLSLPRFATRGDGVIPKTEPWPVTENSSASPVSAKDGNQTRMPYEPTPRERPIDVPVYEPRPRERPVDVPAYEPTPRERPVDVPVYEPTPSERPVDVPVYEPTPRERPADGPTLSGRPADGPKSEPTPKERPVDPKTVPLMYM